ncbi:uncharacterized protein [Argopecten irradians]|uniref:uncharacterized protein n=1 Tax=Argopecten irradians TaxID=31199 RepID=UPI003721E91D
MSAGSNYQGSGKMVEAKSKPKSDGLFIPAIECGVEINCLLDTGSTISVLHPYIFAAIDIKYRPVLSKHHTSFKVADGGLVVSEGAIDATLEISGKLVKHHMVIANISIPAILGYDFLHSHHCKIDMGNGVLHFDGDNLQCKKESQMGSVFSITVAENVVIPPESEMIINANIVGTSTSDADLEALLVEPSSQRLAKEGILVARSLSDPKHNKIIIRVANTNNEAYVLYKGTMAAKGELVSVLKESTEVHTSERVRSVS